MDELMKHNGYAEQSTGMARMPTLKQRLEQAVVDAESRLEDAKRARDILNQHPDLEELMNIMQKGRFLVRAGMTRSKARKLAALHASDRTTDERRPHAA